MSTLVEVPGERGYTRGEEVANTVSAAIGLVVFAGVSPFVIRTALRSAQPWAVTSTAIFLGSIVALYFISTTLSRACARQSEAHRAPSGSLCDLRAHCGNLHALCARPARGERRSAACHYAVDDRRDRNCVQTRRRDSLPASFKPDLPRHGMDGNFLDLALHRERLLAGLCSGFWQAALPIRRASPFMPRKARPTPISSGISSSSQGPYATPSPFGGMHCKGRETPGCRFCFPRAERLMQYFDLWKPPSSC